ncbi:MAG TPA: carboxypeptidase regulatory-like domain-containing protein [Tepidisphaeraceae bacterium]|jgi:plastocyanin
MRRLPLILGLVLLKGCGEEVPEPPRVPAASVVTGSATVSGRVDFDGPVPPAVTLRNQPCCPGAPATLQDETVVVNANGTLANVFVYVEGGPKTEGSALPAPVLDQQFCRYTPHVIGVVVGQPLTLLSSDPTMHNVNIRPTGEAHQNFAMHRAGESAVTRFSRPGFAASKCDVHPWMSAVIGVFDNPFFAVTDGEGRFAIANVPPGTYTLVTRHELYPPLRQTITVPDNATAVNADFRYSPRKP